MTIYDVNDTINYNYLKNCGKISPKNYIINILSLNNRKKIISQYKINKEIFTKSSKIIFHELVNFLITKYIPNNESCKNQLKKYNLEHFNKFIIPINEGTSELKYFYFINIILDWFDKDPENGKSYLTEFKDFFKKKKNIHKIDHIYYIILSICLLYFNNKENEDFYLFNINLMVEENRNKIMHALKLIKDELKESINKMKIKEDTELNLKNIGLKFKQMTILF